MARSPIPKIEHVYYAGSWLGTVLYGRRRLRWEHTGRRVILDEGTRPVGAEGRKAITVIVRKAVRQCKREMRNLDVLMRPDSAPTGPGAAHGLAVRGG